MRRRDSEGHWREVAGNLFLDIIGQRLGMRIGGPGGLEIIFNQRYSYEDRESELPGSTDGAMSGAIFEGEKAACSISAKKFLGYTSI